MKLATYQDGSRDGQLLVVSRDLTSAHYASGIATRLQQVLDDWNFISPQLEELSQTLNHGKARHAFPFEPAKCLAPLPRAFVLAEPCVEAPAPAERSGGAAGPEAARSARSAASLREPQLFFGAGDSLLGARAGIAGELLAEGLDVGAGLAAITGDGGMGLSPLASLEVVRLLMLSHNLSSRRLTSSERAGGSAFSHGRLATAFGPVAVTPDELGPAWRGGKVHLNVEIDVAGTRLGVCDADADMAFSFGTLIAHLCALRTLGAGSVVCGGTLRLADPKRGFACIADKRAAEAQATGEPKTGFLAVGDTVRIEMKGSDGESVFGAIAQSVRAPA